MRDTYHWPHIEHWEKFGVFFAFCVTKKTSEKKTTKVILLGALSSKLTSHFVLLTTWKAIRYLTKQLKRKPYHSRRVMGLF